LSREVLSRQLAAQVLVFGAGLKTGHSYRNSITTNQENS
jgi:hypothetical protein